MDATEALWSARDPMVPILDGASLLTGVDRVLLGELRRVNAVASTGAGLVLDAMVRLDRILTSAQRTRTEVCVHSVRGPIAWAETMTARANALGNDDVFVCKTSERSLDTVGNRLVLHCLDTISGSVPAPDAVWDSFGEGERTLVETRAERARNWLAMAVMARIPNRAPSGRELRRLRSGRRAAEFGDLIEFFEICQGDVPGPRLAALAGAGTPELHAFVLDVARVVAEHLDVPTTWTLVRGRLTAGPLTFRHPGRPGPGVPGLALGGVPLLSRDRIIETADWAGELPARGERVTDDHDVIALLKKMDLARR